MTTAAASAAPPVLEVRGIRHGYGAKPVLDGIDLTVPRGQFVGLVGPSGCGKTTLLNAIVGTHPPNAGEVFVYRNGQRLAVAGPSRHVGIVYQRYSLFPDLTALDNVAIGPLLDRTSIPGRWLQPLRTRRLLAGVRDEARALLGTVGLHDAVDRFPHQLSGGMCQRVAIAQALIMKPELLLLDEPFGALDEAMREQMQELLLQLHRANAAAAAAGQPAPHTVVMVTHELNEALYVGHRVLALSQHWDWRGAGLPKASGARLVYDKATPGVLAGERPDSARYEAQRAELRAVAFDPTRPCHPTMHLTYGRSIAPAPAGAPAVALEARP
ncbi:MAG: ATP-binding cassette domain-containing protein [Myxococcales bacterium]|nr:ATP-binding cassette domain-containing protein [Myxococcales bacterium]